MRKPAGFTLLEFLITLLIVTFALLGIAGILANSLKNDQSAYFRSQAVLLAADVIDRMRANRITAEADPSPYNLALADPTPNGAGVVPTDLREWRNALAGTFPGGTGSVARVATTGKVTIVVQWDDSRGSGGTTTQQMIVEARL
jgi:type IV pilus assembly protein PilV